MIQDLAAKVAELQKLLSQQRFVPSTTGVRIMDDSRKTLLALLNDQRDRRRINGHIYAPNLSVYLNKPAEAPVDFLNELTSALGLTDLGFDETLWRLDRSSLVGLVKSALAGGVLMTVLRNQVWQPLLELHPRRDQGFDVDDHGIDNSLYARVPEFTVVAGDKIEARGTMRFKGYLRVFAGIESQYVGLNTFLGVPPGLIPHGQATFGTGRTSPSVARTVVYAFASKDNSVFRDWPLDHFKPNRLNHGDFLGMVNRFYDAPEDHRVASVQSFITTISPTTGGVA